MRNIRIPFSIVVAIGAMMTGQSAQAAELLFQCSNAASGKEWTLKIDDARHTVDDYPAEMTKAQISWRDTAEGGNYQLDRTTGVLTYTNASSTGGYMLFHRCHVK